MGRAQKIKDLEARKAKLAEQLADLKAEERQAKSRADRKLDTRRKILLGSAVMARVRNGQLPDAEVRGWLTSFLTKPEDLALFPQDQAL